MSKAKLLYVCNSCGAQSPKWAGQCSDCGAWNSLTEQREIKASTGRGRFSGYAGAASGLANVVSLAQISASAEQRIATQNSEFDRVLGGGLVLGSVVLLGGDPGIGKSTLLLQSLVAIADHSKVLYVTGEESLDQVSLRAQRLGLSAQKIRAMAETRLEAILEALQTEKPNVVVIDSIQSIYSDELQSAPGSVAQLRECAGTLVQNAKQQSIAVFLVGHVTKEGVIAGPRVLEHMVDTVLYFEGERDSRYRMIRAVKNRFGAVNELGVFAMTEKGLREVSNPSAIFLSRHPEPVAGSITTVIREGSRPILLEIQALVDESHLSTPKRVTLGLEQNRLSMLIAVLHRHAGIALYDQDVYVNAVGGVRVSETSVDLAVLLASLSSFRNKPIAPDWVVFGEVGLAGEIRPVPNGEERIREAEKHGFKRVVVPKANAPRKGVTEMEVTVVSRIDQIVELI